MKRGPLYRLDHESASRAHIDPCEGVVIPLVDEMAFPATVIRMREEGWSNAEIAVALETSLPHVLAIHKPVWKRTSRCFGCLVWTCHSLGRPRRPYAKQPLGDYHDSSCNGCLLTHLDPINDQVEAPPDREDRLSVLQRDRDAIIARLEEIEVRAELADRWADQVEKAWEWVAKLDDAIEQEKRQQRRRRRTLKWEAE
ncbi:MAG: hypothetical protein AB7S38_28920 [Vulcanimicrobiota bacterium]